MNYFIFLIVLALLMTLLVFWQYYRSGLSKSDQKQIRSKWKQCVVDEPDIRKAILDADKIIDLTLTKLRYTGTLGEKLKKSKSLFSDINAVWLAHKTRNKIAHEIDYQVSKGQGQKHLASFRKALRDLGVKI